MTDRQTKQVSALLVIGMLLALIVACLCTTGCATLRNGVDLEGHVRPAKPDPTVQPAPTPKPPPDDWAPPWFRRPKPTGKIGRLPLDEQAPVAPPRPKPQFKWWFP
jgi:hypothetical protein